MIWGLLILGAALVWLARTHDKHINTLYRQVADLERRLREAEARREAP